ncbi:MAG: potassium channel protein [Archaeoglobus sp.]|nr:MAG: potassium channel protein [Archaeoglobus sp.]
MRTVKDLLIEIKDTSEVIVDLAYSAILFDSEDIAEEVIDLENKINDLLKQIRIVSILAARSVDEAESVSTILQVANASQKMCQAAGDIAELVLRGVKLLPDMVRIALIKSEETVTKVKVSENSKVVGKTLAEVKLHTVTGMKVIAIKRGYKWIFDPERDTKILKGDVLFAKGDISGIPKFYKIITGEERKIEEFEPKLEENLEKAVELLVEMKNLSELAVDLSYLSLLYRDEKIAQEASYIEEKVDNMKYEVQLLVLKSLRNRPDEELNMLLAVLELTHASECIADSAKEIAQIIVEGREIHPIFSEAMKEADEIITMVEVLKGSSLDGKTLGEVRVETNTGMHVIAIKRNNKWLTNPTASTRIIAGDMLVVKGTREGEKLLRGLCFK